MDLVEKRDKLGICLDTCMCGWWLRYCNDLDGVLTEFDRIIGLDHLKAIHLNDSLNPLGSHKDRHARIGEGRLVLMPLSVSSGTRHWRGSLLFWKRLMMMRVGQEKLHFLGKDIQNKLLFSVLKVCSRRTHFGQWVIAHSPAQRSSELNC